MVLHFSFGSLLEGFLRPPILMEESLLGKENMAADLSNDYPFLK